MKGQASRLQKALLFQLDVVLCNAAVDHVQVEGRHIRVDMASHPRSRAVKGISDTALYKKSQSVFVGNLPFDVAVSPLLCLLWSLCLLRIHWLEIL